MLKRDLGVPCGLEEGVLINLASLSEVFSERINKLEKDLNGYKVNAENLVKAKYCKKFLLADMKALREVADEMELLVGKDYHPFPTYEDILYSVKY
jgi:glutamine synthetase